MSNCALCDSLIEPSNDSDEHLILNAIGGRRKLRGILCTACNVGAGNQWDSELASQLSALSLLSQAKRQRGKAPPRIFSTSAGEQLRMDHDGTLSLARPTFEKTPLEDGRHQIRLTVRTIEEARQKLKELKQTYPTIDVDEMLRNAEAQTSYPQGAMTFSADIGGPKAGRSMVKSALCLAVASGIEPAACVEARDFLKRADAEPCFGYYYARDLILNRPVGIPLHCVAVSNRGSQGQLLGYVEFFGIHRAVICLAGQYDGPDVHAVYAVDPVAGSELQVDFELNLPRAELSAIYAYERIPDGAMVAAVEQVMPGIFQKHQERAKDRALAEAIDYAQEHSGMVPGDEITAEQLHTYSRLVAERFVPFILQQRRRVAPLVPPPDGKVQDDSAAPQAKGDSL